VAGPVYYCTTDDLTSYGIRAEALRGIDPDELQRAIGAASAKIDSYLRARYSLPLVRWGTDISEICAKLAVYQLMTVRGFNPARPGEELIRDNYTDAIKALERIEAQRVHPDLVDASNDQDGQSGPGSRPSVTSCVSRGYSAGTRGRGGPFTGRLQ